MLIFPTFVSVCNWSYQHGKQGEKHLRKWNYCKKLLGIEIHTTEDGPGWEGVITSNRHEILQSAEELYRDLYEIKIEMQPALKR